MLSPPASSFHLSMFKKKFNLGWKLTSLFHALTMDPTCYFKVFRAIVLFFFSSNAFSPLYQLPFTLSRPTVSIQFRFSSYRYSLASFMENIWGYKTKTALLPNFTFSTTLSPTWTLKTNTPETCIIPSNSISNRQQWRF